MKRILFCVSVFILVFSLAACNSGNGNNGNNNTTSDMINSAASGVGSIASKVESAMSGMTDGSTTGSKDADTGALKDGKYTAEGSDYDDDGYKAYVEIEVENGKITEIDCDAVNEKGDFKKDDDTFDSWEDKIEMFEDEVELKGLDKITVNDDGTVSGINGMDLKVDEYAKLLKEAIDKAKK